MSTQFNAYSIKETYVRTSKTVMERVWKIVSLKHGSGDNIESPLEAIQGKNVLLLASIINSGSTI